MKTFLAYIRFNVNNLYHKSINKLVEVVLRALATPPVDALNNPLGDPEVEKHCTLVSIFI